MLAHTNNMDDGRAFVSPYAEQLQFYDIGIEEEKRRRKMMQKRNNQKMYGSGFFNQNSGY